MLKSLWYGKFLCYFERVVCMWFNLVKKKDIFFFLGVMKNRFLKIKFLCKYLFIWYYLIGWIVVYNFESLNFF